MMAYPTDARLYWLFGEILNSCGRVEDAQQILDDLVNVNQLSNIRELVAHRRVLVEQAGLLRELRASPLFRLDGQKGVTTLALEQLLWAVAPRTGLDTPVGGPAIAEASWWATAGAIEELQRQERLGRPPALPELP